MTRSERQALKDFVYRHTRYEMLPKGFPVESNSPRFLKCFPNMPEEIREVLLVETAAYLLEHHA